MGDVIDFPVNDNDDILGTKVSKITDETISRMLGNNIRFLREVSDMSLNDLAKEIGMSKGYLWEIEKGRKNPSIGLVLKFCMLFGETFDALLYSDLSGESYLRHMLESDEIEYDEDAFNLIKKLLGNKFFAVNIYNEPGLNGPDTYLCVSNGSIIFEIDCHGNISVVDGNHKSKLMSNVPMNEILEFFRRLYNNHGNNYMKPILN